MFQRGLHHGMRVRQQRLGQLQLQQVARHIGGLECAVHHVFQVPLAKLHHRHVHSYGGHSQAGMPPLLHLLASAVNHPIAQLGNQPRFFSQRNERNWRHVAPAGVLPPEQGLGSAECVGMQIEFGLVMQLELPLLKASPHVGQHVQVVNLLPLDSIEPANGIAPRLLGPLHGHVGAHQQLFGCVAIGREHDQANGRGDADVNARQPDRAGNVRQPVNCAFRRERIVGNFTADDQKLVTASAKQLLMGQQRGGQPVSQCDQKVISRPRAQRLVDALEKIQVDKHDRCRAVAGC